MSSKAEVPFAQFDDVSEDNEGVSKWGKALLAATVVALIFSFISGAIALIGDLAALIISSAIVCSCCDVSKLNLSADRKKYATIILVLSLLHYVVSIISAMILIPNAMNNAQGNYVNNHLIIDTIIHVILHIIAVVYAHFFLKGKSC